ncbi:hypothetical protein CCR95_20915 [Thiocystis minor]|uniref:helix-turn-helix domain-containing protein n=1 Tax=Thiocystis minor TaxID=61597 RepID=UPI0019131639|nr:helix-turn-helix domain-containing protein [Thiocystis minor]MBK5966468.1 hypothetical protein [Thiocystis minor]
MKPTSFRLPADALDRIRRLAQPGESQASVILRGLLALEGSPPPMSMEALASRLEAVESRLDDLEGGSAPVVQTASKKPTDTRSALVVRRDKAERDRLILDLAATGMKNRAIGRQLGIPESTVRSIIERHAKP